MQERNIFLRVIKKYTFFDGDIIFQCGQIIKCTFKNIGVELDDYYGNRDSMVYDHWKLYTSRFEQVTDAMGRLL